MNITSITHQFCYEPAGNVMEMNSHLCTCSAPSPFPLVSWLWIRSPEWDAKRLSSPHLSWSCTTAHTQLILLSFVQTCSTSHPSNTCWDILVSTQVHSLKNVWQYVIVSTTNEAMRSTQPHCGLACRALCLYWSQVSQWLFQCHLPWWLPANIHFLSGPAYESKCREKITSEPHHIHS